MSWKSQRRKLEQAEFEAFLARVTSNTGGYYETLQGRPVEFVRPLKCPYIRMKDLRSGAVTNLDFRSLKPLNEMAVLGYMVWDEKDERAAQRREWIKRGPETVSTPIDRLGEPQEPGDVEFIH